jgi:hypothetical protein
VAPAKQSTYEYTPDSSLLQTQSTISLIVTGLVDKTLRTVKVTLRRRTFIDFLYFTNYETQDPASYDAGDPFTPAQAQVVCALHYYEGRNPACITIYFSSRDVINGPLHSNDAINVSGTPTFNGNASTSWNDPAGKRYLGTPGSVPKFKNVGDPKYASFLPLPPSNQSIKTETNAAPVGSGGCLYTGPTKIILNSTGTMTVTSPMTKSSLCGTGTVPIPADGVVFVQNVPSVPTDPNYTMSCPVGSGNPLGYPISGDITTYGCKDGDVFVSGSLKGRLTIAAEHNIDIIGNLQYAGGLGGQDLLGLVANNYVEVYHPVKCTAFSGGNCVTWSNMNVIGGNPFTNPVIQAAMLSVTHSFRVQNFDLGAPLGTLTINGAIAQNYRGPVGTFSGGSTVSGYDKAYSYDQRLKYLEPPHFLDPVQSAWQIVTWAEVVPDITP